MARYEPDEDEEGGADPAQDSDLSLEVDIKPGQTDATPHLERSQLAAQDLGQMIFIADRILVVRSSNSILFFKKEAATKTEESRWKQFHKLNEMRGDLDYVKGTKRFQITTERKVYFYRLDKEKLEPIQENVMYNFMNSSNVNFTAQVAVSYKTSQPDFQVYSRAHEHNFNVKIQGCNYENASAQVLY